MNIFYHPEAFGLRLLNSMHAAKLNTTVAIWMRDDRKIFWGFWDHYDDARIFHEVGVHELKSATDRAFCAFDVNAWTTINLWADEGLWRQGQEFLMSAWRQA